MSRLHVHISVEDIAQNIRFYSALFGVQPSINKNEYAKWDLQDPAVNFAISKRGATAGLDHVGIQTENDAELNAIQSRLEQAGIAGHKQKDAACCYARSDKYWTQDPQGVAWEAFHSLDSIPTFSCGTDDTTENSCCVPESSSSGMC